MKACFPRSRRRGTIGVALAVALLSSACGGGGGTGNLTFSTGSTGSSSLLVNIGDAPVPNLLSFQVTVNSISLVGTPGTVTLVNTPVRLELTHLAATVAPLMLSTVPNGTYNQLTFSFSNASAVVLQNGVATGVSVAVPPGTFTVNLASAMVINGGTTTLNIDFHLANSLAVDALGNFTFNPATTTTANLVPSGGATSIDNGLVEDLHGTVLSVASPQFTVVTQENPNGITFTTDGTTAFSGASGLSQLAKGNTVDVAGGAQTTGTLLAKTVEVETESGTQGLETEGIITNTSGSPAVTQFTIIAADSTSSTTSLQPTIGQTVLVTIAPNATFRISDQVDLTGVSFTPVFDATTIAPGMEVEADTNVASISSITATRVNQGLQAIDGTIISLVQNGTRATFNLQVPANSAIATLTGLTSIPVFQQPSTEVKGVTVANNANVRVRGALFFNNGTYEFIAKRITTP